MGGRRTDEITVLEVEAVQLVARLLGIHYVFIDNECRSFGIIRNSLTDLTRWSVCCMVLGVMNIPNWTKLSEEVEELLWCDVVAVTHQHLPSSISPCQYSIVALCISTYLRFLTNNAL